MKNIHHFAINYIVEPFIHSSNYHYVFFKKLLASFIISILLSPFSFLIHLLKKYILADINFVEILSVILTMELVTGIWKHLKLGDFHGKKLAIGFIEKVLVAFVFMILFNAVAHLGVFKGNESVLKWLSFVAQMVIIVYVLSSAANSIFVITEGKLPPVKWMQKMAQFSSTGDAKELLDEVKKSVPQTNN